MHSLIDLWYGFGVALQPDNLMWSVFGVLVGNLIGVLPGMGALSTISMLLPLTYVIAPVPAILMLAGIFYGSQYGGAIGAILLNLPSHPPHAVTCLDGYPMTLQGKRRHGARHHDDGVVLRGLGRHHRDDLPVAAAGAGRRSSSGPTEICSIMLLGLLAGATMSRGSPLKGVAMTIFGLLCGVVGTDVDQRHRALHVRPHRAAPTASSSARSAMGLFGIADFLVSVNRTTVQPARRQACACATCGRAAPS